MQKNKQTDTPLSESSVSLKLSLIQKECERLMQEDLERTRCLDTGDFDLQSERSFNPYDSG